MCGICGVLYKDRSRQASEEIVVSMCSTIVHRGPDDEGYIVSGNVGLGMRRLSIIDLSTGHQPILNEDGSKAIVFNGEIYNHNDLRYELESKGHIFKTKSDTEAILHGYEEWGADVCSKLNGMFAFAIWDRKRESLFLARDRMGIKPFYVYEDREKIVFGSEIKSILRHPDIDRDIDLQALDNFLAFEYIPAPRSIFRKIRKIKPAHWMKYENGKMSEKRYWQVVPHEKNMTLQQAEEKLSFLLSDSVKLRLLSDVPLGAFLSGGLDSSILVSLMAKASREQVKTFSIGFKESSYNELNYARAVAKKYNTEHHEFIIQPDALDLTEKLIKQLDEPFGDFSIFPTYLVSKMAREYVTVSLSGDGGDELFGGYDTYRAHMFAHSFYSKIPDFVKKGFILPAANALPPTKKKKGAVNSFKRFVEGTLLPEYLYHARWMVFLSEKERRKLLSDEILSELSKTDRYDFIRKFNCSSMDIDDVTRTGFIDLNTYLIDNILVKVDRMSMASSLEARVPYLDHRVVEFAFSLPPQFKMDRLSTKVILKKTFRDNLPDEIKNRGKQGFSIPIKNWIRKDLKEMMTGLLDKTKLNQQGFFKTDFVEKMMREHIQGRANHSHKLWALMVFEQWYDIYGKG